MSGQSRRQPMKSKPVVQPQSKQPAMPNPGGAISQQASSNQPPMENKENPSTMNKPEPTETKETDTSSSTNDEQGRPTPTIGDPSSADEHDPSDAPISTESDEDADFYYDPWGHRVIRHGRPVTVRAEKVNNRMVVMDTVLQEIPQQGTKSFGKHQIFFKGQEISETMLRQSGAKTA